MSNQQLSDAQIVLAQKQAELALVREDAGSWTKLLGAILGVFATAAFVGGKPTLEKLTASQQDVAKWATTVALLLLLVATITAGLVEGKNPKLRPEMSPDAEQADVQSKTTRNLTALIVSKCCGILAAVIIVLGSIYFLWQGETTPAKTPPTVLAVTTSGVACGELARDAQKALTVDSVALPAGTLITIVDACP